MTLFIANLNTAAQTLLPLKELKLPDAISWWPLAPGWWILLVLVIGLLFCAIFLLRKWWLSNQDRRETLRLLKSVYAQWQAGGRSQEYILQVNTALKCFCRDRFPEALSLSGESWINFLNRRAGITLFDGDIAKALAQGAYMPEQDDRQIPAQQIMQASLSWLKKASPKHSPEKL